MKNLFLILVCLFICSNVYSQELKADVQVQVTDPNSQTDEDVLQALERAVSELINNTKWTDDVYENHERIDCSFFFKITENKSNTQFKGELQVQARRPIYNSSYTSTTLLINDDKVTFRYNQFDPIQYTENAYTDELTALIGFYVYLILGNDYDTFQKKGGTAHYEKALNIVNLSATSSAATGWKANEKDENRYWLINNALDQFYEPLREINYTYYREAMDQMHKDLPSNRTKISTALKKIDKIHATKPNNYNVNLFFYSRADELINMYKGAPTAEKIEMVKFLKKVNPANVSKYNKILSSR